MPTTTVESPVTDPAFQNRVAKELALWWRREGADVNHVITRFAGLAGDRVFSGPYPLGDDPAFAFITCVIAADRDREFRRRCAVALREAVGPEVPPDRVFVAFRPTVAADHYVPDSGNWDDAADDGLRALTSSAGLEAGGSAFTTPALTTPADDSLRGELRVLLSDLLSRPLAPSDDGHLLAELAPDRYDSLGVLDAVGLVETGFGVAIDLVTDDLRSTFASVAAIADLVERKLRDSAILEGRL